MLFILLHGHVRLFFKYILLSKLSSSLLLQYKDRIDKNLIKPAVNFRETGSRSATMKAAVSS